MKTISIHGVDNRLNNSLKETAARMGTSLNKAIKHLLEKALGLSGKNANRGRFEDLCGVWSENDRGEFEKSTEAFEKIDPSDWKS